MKKVLFVGEAISKEGQQPLVGKASQWLANVAEMPHEEFLVKTERANLMSKPTSRWPASYARTAACRMFGARYTPSDFKAIVLLGRRVQAAAWPILLVQAPFTPMGLAGYWHRTPVYFVPHPSGRCRWWNDLTNRRGAGILLRHIFA